MPTGMRKIFPRPGLRLVPAICLLTSCASYKMAQPPPSSAAGGHEFLYVLSTWYTGTGDPDTQSATYGYSVSVDGRLTPLAGRMMEEARATVAKFPERILVNPRPRATFQRS